MWKRPHYISLKHKITLKYQEHTIEMVKALQQLDSKTVIEGNVHGLKALLLVLDLITILQHKAPAFKMTSTLK